MPHCPPTLALDQLKTVGIRRHDTFRNMIYEVELEKKLPPSSAAADDFD